VTGTFRHEDERHVYAIGQVYEKSMPGYHIYTPLQRPNGDWLLINRGWVPEDKKAPASRAQAQVAGDVTVTGILRLSRERAAFAAPHQPEENIWFAPNIGRLSESLGYALMPVIIDAGPDQNPGGWPQGGTTRVTMPNDHLQYALTWYGLALTALVVYGLYVKKARQRRE
jgi:surfeit locus 1 family protein